MPPIDDKGADQNANGGTAPASGERPASAPPQFDISTLFGPGGGGLPGENADDNLAEGEQNTPPAVEKPAAAAEATPATPATPDPTKPLTDATAALTRAAEALSARATPAPAKEEPAPAKVWLTPEQIPTAMVQLLNSEDPAERVKGFALFANALLHMHQEHIQNQIQTEYQPQFMAQVQEHYRNQRAIEDWKSEMTRDYPVLINTEEGKMVARLAIERVAQKMQAEGVPANQISWSHPKFKSEFNGVLKSLNVDPKLGATPAPAPPPPTPPAPAPTKFRAAAAGARPEQPSGETNTQADGMLAVLRSAGVGPRTQ